MLCRQYKPFRQKSQSAHLFPLQAFDVLLHPVCAGFLHLVCCVGVDVQRKRRCGVAEVFLYGFDVVSVFDGSNCVAVSEIVKAHIFHANRFDDALEAVIDGAMSQKASQRIGKHQIVFVVPRKARILSHVALLFLLRAKQRKYAWRNRQNAAFPVLGR